MTDKFTLKEIIEKLHLSESDYLPFGYDKAKIITDNLSNTRTRKGKIILCTAITPTKAGEGKTTTAIGLADGLSLLGADAMLCLREPSLGPVFGVKGGGAGGGEEILIPEEDINLHFTGDIHAISAVNNLIVAMIDNELYQHSTLQVDPERIVMPRCMDMNERSLRDITVSQNDPHTVPHQSGFVITAASEVMAVFCLAKNEEDFLNRIEGIMVAYNTSGEPIYVRDLEMRNAIQKLIHTALYPNLVQTKYKTPALVHGGPFANIAHGTNSIISTDLALKLSDYVVTEAGFGSDLGMEKYLDIVSQIGSFHPSLIVMVATIRALKLHGGVKFENLNESNPKAVSIGLANLKKHIENVGLYNIPVLVSVNRFKSDTDDELRVVTDYLIRENIDYAINTSYLNGPSGAYELAEKAKELVDAGYDRGFAPIITHSMNVKDKINTIAREIYNASDVEFSDLAKKQISSLKHSGFGDFDVCISKTPNSLSDDPKLLNVPKKHILHVRSIRLFTGARFIVPLTGDVFTMPGLSKVPAAKNMESTEK
ncbi:MAG: formate--tetrahydrofolate ligase [Bacilli bacterium]